MTDDPAALYLERLANDIETRKSRARTMAEYDKNGAARLAGLADDPCDLLWARRLRGIAEQIRQGLHLIEDDEDALRFPPE